MVTRQFGSGGNEASGTARVLVKQPSRVRTGQIPLLFGRYDVHVVVDILASSVAISITLGVVVLAWFGPGVIERLIWIVLDKSPSAIGKAQSNDAVDPSMTNTGTLTTRA